MEITEENWNEIFEQLNNKYLGNTNTWILGKQGIKFNHKEGDPFYFWGKDSLIRINTLVKNIPKYFQKHNSAKKFWNTSSKLGSNHYMNDSYFDNLNNSDEGEFILAMWLSDIDMKPLPKNLSSSPVNVTFNCTRRNLDKVFCDCGIQYRKLSKQQHLKSKTHNLIMNKLFEKDIKQLIIDAYNHSTQISLS